MIIFRLKFVFSDSEMKRITINDSKEVVTVTVDVHGLKCFQAKRFINNIINLIQVMFKLVVIHGYNHGTAIKDMLSNDFSNEHVMFQTVDPNNKGVTYMLIRI